MRPRETPRSRDTEVGGRDLDRRTVSFRACGEVAGTATRSPGENPRGNVHLGGQRAQIKNQGTGAETRECGPLPPAFHIPRRLTHPSLHRDPLPTAPRHSTARLPAIADSSSPGPAPGSPRLGLNSPFTFRQPRSPRSPPGQPREAPRRPPARWHCGAARGTLP